MGGPSQPLETERSMMSWWGPAQPQTAGSGADLPRTQPVLTAPTAEVHTRLAGPCSRLGTAPSQRAQPALPAPPTELSGWLALLLLPRLERGWTSRPQQGHPAAGPRLPRRWPTPAALRPLPLSHLGFSFGETKTGRVQGLSPPTLPQASLLGG